MKPSLVLLLFVRAARGPAISAGVLAWLLLSLGAVGQAVVGASLAPSPILLARLLLGAAGTSVSLAIGLAALAGVAGGVGQLRDDRALLALSALGMGPGRLAAAAVAWSLPFVGAWLLSAHVLEPWARASVRDARVEAAASVVPTDMRTVHVGNWYFAVDAGRLRFTDGTVVGDAGGWSFTAHTGGVLVDLIDTNVVNDTMFVHADQAALPLPISRRGAVHVSERDTPDLIRQIARSAALGRAEYERWLLWKRTVLPLSLAPLAVGAAGYARRSAPGVVVGAVLLGIWLAVRLLDAEILVLGVEGATVVFSFLCALLAMGGWRRRPSGTA